MNDNEVMDEMKIVIKNKITRDILSSIISKAVNDKLPIGLYLKIDEVTIETLLDGTLTFKLSAKGTANKDKIINLIKNKGEIS